MTTIICTLMILAGTGIIFGAWLGSEIGDTPIVIVFAMIGGATGAALGLVLMAATWVLT